MSSQVPPFIKRQLMRVAYDSNDCPLCGHLLGWHKEYETSAYNSAILCAEWGCRCSAMKPPKQRLLAITL